MSQKNEVCTINENDLLQATNFGAKEKKSRHKRREEKRREEKFVTRVGPAESEPNKTLKLVGTATPPKEKFYKRVGLTEITESSPTKTLKLLRTATPSDEKES